MTLALRRAGPEDAERLWRWRNDPAARAASHVTDPAPWDAHRLWFEQSLTRVDRLLLVGVYAETREPVGLVRFDVRDLGVWTVGINVAPDFRGLGLGKALLRVGMARLAEQRHVGVFEAEVRLTNAASLALFEHCGFARAGEAGGFARFEKAVA
ncbi:MAG TPA: GNAT family N-acetyltransferase [Caulobacteraceae bacterium]|nr:GNAT family N-acetyltransferase [Caulobacteraceae bacterium]